MNRLSSFAIVGVTCLALALCSTACKSSSKKEKEAKPEKMPEKVATVTIKSSAAAATQPVNNNVTGTLTITQSYPHAVHISGSIMGLAPNSTHGLHIHEKGDLTAADLSSAGPHYNPTGAHHGGPPDDNTNRHAGDLGNVTANASGVVTITDLKVQGVSLEGDNAIAGRSIILHAKDDDLKTDPAGNSGARIAGGVIEMKK